MSVTGDADLDHLVKLLSAEHLHCEVAIVPLLLINILEEILWDYASVLFLIKLSQLFWHPFIDLA